MTTNIRLYDVHAPGVEREHFLFRATRPMVLQLLALWPEERRRLERELGEMHMCTIHRGRHNWQHLGQPASVIVRKTEHVLLG